MKGGWGGSSGGAVFGKGMNVPIRFRRLGVRLARACPLGAVLAGVIAGCRSGPSHEDTAKAMVQQADEWYRVNDFNKAGKLYTDALALDPDLPEAALGLGNVRRVQCEMELEHYIGGDVKKGIDVYQVQKLYGEAVKFFTRADEGRSDYRDVYYSLGMLYFALAKNKTLPNTPEWNASRRNWLDACREQFERAQKLAPELGAPHEYLAQVYNLIGIDLAARGDTAAAVETLEKSKASCDAFLAWFWKQRYKDIDPKGFDDRVKAFEDLKVDLDGVIARLHPKPAPGANGGG